MTLDAKGEGDKKKSSKETTKSMKWNGLKTNTRQTAYLQNSTKNENFIITIFPTDKQKYI